VLDWRRPDGQARAMSVRVALSKMAADGLITLPPPRNGNGNIPRHLPAGQGELFETAAVTGALASLGALTFRPVTTRAGSRTWNDLIAACHYPGCTPLAGAQLRYLIRVGQAGTIAAISFGASAWKCAARDTLTGWAPHTVPGLSYESNFVSAANLAGLDLGDIVLALLHQALARRQCDVPLPVLAAPDLIAGLMPARAGLGEG
jgi:hypothetical protein